jgi:hypothetical protein
MMKQSWIILLCVAMTACDSDDPAGDIEEGLGVAPGTMSNGENHSGSILLAGETDTWTLSANAGDAISLSLSEVTDTGSFQPWIRLWAPNGAQLGNQWSGAVAQINVGTAPQTGLYTVVIGSYDGYRIGTGTYQLTLAQSPGSFIVPPGDDGGSMVNGANHTGTIHQGDLDQWTFQANAGDAISLSLSEVTDTGSFQPWIRLWAPNGAQLGNQWSGAVAQINVGTAPQTGLYTVVIGSYDGYRIGTGTYTTKRVVSSTAK